MRTLHRTAEASVDDGAATQQPSRIGVLLNAPAPVDPTVDDDDPSDVTASDRTVAHVAADLAVETVMPQRSLLSASVVPAIGTALSRITGMTRVAALTAALGLTSIADIYNLANTSPNIVYELVIGGVLSSTLVPLFIQAHQDKLKDIDDDAESVMVTVGLSAITVLTILAMLAAPLINRMFALPLHGADRAHQLRLGTDFLLLLFPQVFFYGLTTLATALLHSRRRFAAPAFAPVLTNIVVSIAALAVYRWAPTDSTETRTVYLLGVGTTAGIAAMAVALLPALRRAEVHLRWDFRPKHPAVKAVLRLSGWTVGFAVANQIALLIILTFARGAGAGAVSAYQYAFIFFQLPYGLIAVSLMTVVLPELSTAANAGDQQAFAAKFREGLSLMLTLMIPAAGAYVFFGRPLIAVLLQRGQFTAGDTDQTLAMLTGFAFGLPAFSVFLYCMRAFYARKNTRTPFYLNLGENALNVALVLPMVALIGEPGLAAAYSIAYIIAAGVALVVLTRAVPGLWGENAPVIAYRVVATSFVVIIGLAAVARFISDSTSAVLQLLIAAAVAVPVTVVAIASIRPLGFEPLLRRFRRAP